MKNFRSSKNLRVVESSGKDESNLRMKVKVLEEQVELLQKSNLNIFIPLSEHENKNTPNYEAIINKLKTQILNLQQESQSQKTRIKKLQNQKEMMKITHQNEMKQLEERIMDLIQEKKDLNEQIDNLDELLDRQKLSRAELEKQNIEMKVQNKFLKDDIASGKKRLEQVQKKFQELNSKVLAVQFYSRIFRSKQMKVTAIETAELAKLKRHIEELQQRIKELLEANRQEKIHLGVKKKDIGEEIVRLKKNIDLQLGLPLNQSSTKAFLDAYQDTNGCFDQLIKACKK